MDLDHLNAAQRAAVTAPAGYHLVVAGAGTGKTRTLVHRLAWLLDQGQDPAVVVLLTFTRRAAEEMLRRASALVGGKAHRVRGGTFHSFAHGVLRRHGDRIGLGRAFTVLDRGDAADMVGLVRTELALGGKGRRFPQKDTLLKLISTGLNTGRSLSALVDEQFPWFLNDLPDIERLAARYAERKLAQDVLDYDDLLVHLDRLLKEHADARREIAGGCRHVLVYEYQDTNRLQGRIAALLSVVHGSLMVVGDEAQSIYRFRGATVENILRFPTVFSGTQVTVLEENYRSTQPVLDLANAVLASAKERFDKLLHSQQNEGPKPVLIELADDGDQAGVVVQRVLELREQGVGLRRMAVLFRSAWHANLLELELGRANIPFRKFGGIQFLEAAHVKDVFALLRVAANPRDGLAWFRVLQLFEGVGKGTAQRIGDAVLAADPPALDPAPWAGRRFGPDLAQLADLLADIQAHRQDVGAVVERVLGWYLPRLPALYDDAGPRAKDLESLPVLADGHRDLDRFLAEVALEPPSGVDTEAADAEDEWISLSTIHSAKGLEWHTVFVLALADGAFPSGYSLQDPELIEEERRLFYVAVTRAERCLFLLAPRIVRGRGLTGLGQGCRLLDELPDLDQRVERIAEGHASGSEAAPEPAGEAEAARLAAVLSFYDG